MTTFRDMAFDKSIARENVFSKRSIFKYCPLHSERVAYCRQAQSMISDHT